MRLLLFVIVALLSAYTLAGCSDNPSASARQSPLPVTKVRPVTKYIAIRRTRVRKTISSDPLERDKKLYYQATMMLGGVHAIAEATQKDPSQLASYNGVQFERAHKMSESRMKMITEQGEKNNWPDGYDLGEALERHKLREQGYKFSGDL